MLKARRLKQQLELYKLYQKMGLTTLQEIKHYEADKKNQEKEAKYRKQRESASYLYENRPAPSSSNRLSALMGESEENEDTGSSNNNDDLKGNKRRRGKNETANGMLLPSFCYPSCLFFACCVSFVVFLLLLILSFS
jgi:hypothetical protein